MLDQIRSGCKPTHCIIMPRSWPAYRLPTRCDGVSHGHFISSCYSYQGSTLCSWVEQLPLRTASRALHSNFPDTRYWSIRPGPAGDDGDVFRHFTWSFGEGDLEQHSMLIAIQPSWILTPRDFDDFVGCKRVRAFSVQFRPRVRALRYQTQFPLNRPKSRKHEETDAYETKCRLRSKERIWAKV